MTELIDLGRTIGGQRLLRDPDGNCWSERAALEKFPDAVIRKSPATKAPAPTKAPEVSTGSTLADITMRRILRGEYSDAPVQPDSPKPQTPTLSKVQQLALKHPAWPEYAALPDAVRQRAFRNDFSRFLYCQEHGLLPQVQASVEKAIEAEIREELQSRERRERERAIENAEREDPERYRAMMDRIQGNPNYPGLQRA